MVVCETEKMSFPSYGEAMKFGLSINDRKHNKDPIRAYLCPKCNQHHLTSTSATKLKERSKNKMRHSDDKYHKKINPYQYSYPK